MLEQQQQFYPSVITHLYDFNEQSKISMGSYCYQTMWRVVRPQRHISNKQLDCVKTLNSGVSLKTDQMMISRQMVNVTVTRLVTPTNQYVNIQIDGLLCDIFMVIQNSQLRENIKLAELHA